MTEVNSLPLFDLDLPSPPYLDMNIGIWNCRGALNPSFQNFVHDLV